MTPTLIALSESFCSRQFDAAAMATLRDNPDSTRKTLVGIINRVASEPEAFHESTGESSCASTALILLTEFGTPEALPGLLGAVSHPWRTLDPVFGDSLLEDAPEAFAACAASEPERLLRLAEQDDTTDPVRFLLMSAAVRHLARGTLPADRVTSTARRLLPRMCATAKAALLAGEDEYDACFPVSYLVGELEEVLVHELKSELLEVFQSGLMLHMYMHESDVSAPQDATDELARARFRARHPQPMDAGKNLESWCRPHAQAGTSFASAAGPKPQVKNLPPERTREGYVQGKTFVRSAPKISPNDPCSCGSGKKYKKCCADKPSAA